MKKQNGEKEVVSKTGKWLAGRIEWDEQYEGRLPLVIIDGKEYTWEELGEMLMSFEGWDFKLKIFENWEEEVE